MMNGHQILALGQLENMKCGCLQKNVVADKFAERNPMRTLILMKILTAMMTQDL